MKKGISIIGLQNGDEGKGKIVHYLASATAQKAIMEGRVHQPILVERYQGGPNAGHTIVEGKETYKLHQIPSGITTPKVFNLLGEGMFLNPRKLQQEIQELQQRGISISSSNLGISATAQVTLDYHVQEDQSEFQKVEHTSTGNGIKQTAIDKAGRVGIRFVEFLDPELMMQCLQRRFPEGMPTGLGGDYEQFVQSYASERAFLSPFLTQQHMARKTHGTQLWIGEGAQGFLLDMDSGQYPGVTSSNPGAVPWCADTILGVVKLYSSSVGTGDRPFVPRMTEGLETKLRIKWNEFGATTGKKREIGWFDAVAVKYALESTGADYMIGTCGDRLEELAKLNREIRIVTGYKIGRRVFREWDESFHRRDTFYDAEPIFEELEPWDKFTESDGTTLTVNAQRYVERIQKLTGREFVILGTGPGKDQVITYKKVLEL